MTAIYEPKGRAREYGDLAVNLYTGCPHGCKYCYVPGILRITPKAFHVPAESKPRILEQIGRWAEKNAPSMFEDKPVEPVFLCFTCDPYPAGCDTETTRSAIQILNGAGHPVKILTKNGSDARRDVDLLAQNEHNSIGVTITSGSNSGWEPGAPPTYVRMTGLKYAHDHGIKTWISIEPPIESGAIASALEYAKRWVDFVWVGHWNHSGSLSYDDEKVYRAIKWPAFYEWIKDFLEANEIKHGFKKDLLIAAGAHTGQ